MGGQGLALRFSLLEFLCLWLVPIALVMAPVVTAQSPATDSGNLLRNPNFDEAVSAMPGWFASATGGSKAGWSEEGHEGSGAGYIRKVKDGQSHVSALAQNVQAKPNTRYTLSGYAYATGVVAGEARLFAYEYDAQGDWLGNTAWATAPFSTDNQYSPIQVQFVTRPQTASLQVRYEIYGLEAEGEAYLDRVYLGTRTEPPAPVSDVQSVALADGYLVSWSAPATGEAKHYNIYRGSSPGFAVDIHSLVGTTSQTEWVDSGSSTIPAGALGPLMQGLEPPRYYAVVAMDEALNVSEASYGERTASELKEPVVGWLEGTWKLRQDEWPLQLKAAPVRISAARNEFEPFQVVVRAGAEPIDDLRVGVSDLVAGPYRIKAEHVQVHASHYVNVKSVNPAFRSGWYPDALIPVNATTIAVAPDTNQSIWFTVYVPSETPPGRYKGRITLLSAGSTIARIPIELEVWPFTLPVESHQESAFGLWLDQVAEAHDSHSADLSFFDIAWRYYWFLVDHRLMPSALPFPVESPRGLEALADPRVVSFRLPWPWEQTENPGFERILRILREEGVLQKGYVYSIDEPLQERFGLVKEMGEAIGLYGSDVRRLVTVNVPRAIEQLAGAVDIWSPNLAYYDHEVAQKRQSLGEEIWWYTCIGPQAPYPTYLIDDVAMSHRVLSWLQVKYGVDGTLYWSTTVFKKWNGSYYESRDVWNDAEAFPGGYGDGYLLYPGKAYGIDGPLSTVRLAMIREGNEDLEYFWLYRTLARKSGLTDEEIEAQVQKLIEPVARDLRDWEKDPRVLYAQREALAREISRMSQEIGGGEQ